MNITQRAPSEKILTTRLVTRASSPCRELLEHANGIAYSTEALPNNHGDNEFFTHIEGNLYQFWRADPYGGDKKHRGPDSRPTPQTRAVGMM